MRCPWSPISILGEKTTRKVVNGGHFHENLGSTFDIFGSSSLGAFIYQQPLVPKENKHLGDILKHAELLPEKKAALRFVRPKMAPTEQANPATVRSGFFSINERRPFWRNPGSGNEPRGSRVVPPRRRPFSSQTQGLYPACIPFDVTRLTCQNRKLHTSSVEA